MELERLTAELRPRNPWEAIDLGIQMARHRYWKLWFLWWLSALPVTLVLGLALQDYPQYLGTAVWWFKPLFEPVLVLWLSRALFGEDLSFPTLRRDWWKVTRPRLLANLAWRRFSPNRSLLMPITLLEQPGNADWRARSGVFTRQFSGGAWWTLVAVHFEAVLTIGLVLGIAMLVPQPLLPDWQFQDWLSEQNTLMSWAWSITAVLAMSLIAPFYVGGGFALYLARRTSLEGWDIELRFRQLVRHLPGLVLPLACLAVLLVSSTDPAVAWAAADWREEAASTIERVLQSEDFGRQETLTRWRLRTQDDQALPRSFQFDLQGLATALELLGWIAVSILAGWVIFQAYRYRNHWRDRQPVVTGAKQHALVSNQPKHVDDPLPLDVQGAVRECLSRGDQRAALGLLYSASLQLVQHRCAVQLEDSFTERECLAAVRGQCGEPEHRFLARLTRHWIRLAYASHPPGREQLEVLLTGWCELAGCVPQREPGQSDPGHSDPGRSR